MTAERFFLFPPFEVDTLAGNLRRDAQEIVLRAKTFALLCYFLERPGQLVSKDELLSALWPDTFVTEGVLTVCMTELRKALGDDTKKPRFITTVPKRGYRFIAEVVSSQHSVVSRGEPSGVRSPASEVENFYSALRNPQSAINLVGRDADLAHLHSLFAKVSSGQRQVVFVTGEPGIGKTSLVDAFRQRLEAGGWGLAPSSQASSLKPPASPVSFAHGQCIEHYGAGEAYLPILDALGQLCRGEGGEKVVELLGRHAPTWLVQMPEFLNATDSEAVQKRVVGATRERMLREMTGALEALTADRPLVLVLEDLHWSDYSTVDLVSFIARRQSPARLMIIGTYRPGDVLQREHPLLAAKQELQLHGQCEELALAYLTQEDVGEYLARQFPGSQFSVQVGTVVHQRTEGNPLFMVNVVHELVEQGVIVQREEQWELVGAVENSVVPLGLRQFIEQQVTRVTAEERAVLEAASVVGMGFSIAAVAAAIGGEVPTVETICETLARRSQLVHGNGISTWPDGTAAGRYRFLHALYQEVLYEQISAGRRAGLHRHIGERIEAAYGNRAKEVAAELAVHFELGQDMQRAVQYLGQAGENAIRQNAHVEAIHLLNHAIALLQTLPDTPERAQQELGLYLLLRTPLIATKGYVASEVERAYARASELCRQVGQPPQLFLVLGGPYALHLLRGEIRAAYAVAEERMSLAENLQFDLFTQVAHLCLGGPLLFMGKFSAARAHLEQSLALYKPQQLSALGHLYDPGVMGLTLAAFVLWIQGYPDQARQRSREALTLARELAHPFSLAYALGWAARIRRLCGEPQTSENSEDEWRTLCVEHGFTHQLAMATITHGWGLIEEGREEEGLIKVQQGLAAYRATREELGSSSYLILLAETYGKTGNVAEGFTTFAEAQAFIAKSEERFWEAELYRLKGKLTLQEFHVSGSTFHGEKSLKSKVQSPKDAVTENQEVVDGSSSPQVPSLKPLAPSGVEVEGYFLKAIEIARRQQAKSLELRATTSLVRLWQQQGKRYEAHQMLSELYAWFTEGFDTRDVQEAQALLDVLTQESGAETSLPESAQQETPVPNLRLVVNKEGNAQRPPHMPVAKRGRR